MSVAPELWLSNDKFYQLFTFLHPGYTVTVPLRPYTVTDSLATNDLTLPAVVWPVWISTEHSSRFPNVYFLLSFVLPRKI